MTTPQTTNPTEVWLNGVKYPLRSTLKPELISVFPDKQVTGDYTADSNPLASSWVISDCTGGIGVKEIDEVADIKRCWWATVDTRYKAQIRLQTLPVVIGAPKTLSYATPSNSSSTTWNNPENIRDNNLTTASSQTVVASSWSGYLVSDQNAANCVGIRTYFLDVQEEGGTKIEVSLYYGASWHVIYSGLVPELMGKAQWTSFVMKTEQSVTSARIRMYNGFADARYVICKEINFINTTGAAAGAPTLQADFENNLLQNFGADLDILNGAGTGFTPLITFAQTPIKIIGEVNSCAVILFGTGYAYFYIKKDATNGGFIIIETNYTTAGDNGVVWDNKMFLWDNATNTVYYSTSPNTTTPSYTANGVLDLVSIGALYRLYVDQNSAGNQVIYGATKEGLWEHDYANAAWLQTGLKVPNHPNGGKGACVWRENAYFSLGLDIFAYNPSSSDSIDSMGLSKDDGIPAEYNGEVVKLVPGLNAMYALVDSTQATGTSTSWIAAYNGVGWFCEWVASATETALLGGVLSTDFAYRLWFINGTAVTYLPMNRNIDNPSQLTTKDYVTAGTLIIGWNNGGWRVGNKRANQVRIGFSGATATETLVIKYRINHSNDDLSTGWTTLGTITTGTEVVYSFGSGAGTLCKEIQFAIDFARGSTSTLFPNLKYLTLEYNKIIPKVWGWSMELDCSEDTDTSAAKQRLANLITAAETETLVTLRFEPDGTTYYVEIVAVEGTRNTGEETRGSYVIKVREVM